MNGSGTSEEQIDEMIQDYLRAFNATTPMSVDLPETTSLSARASRSPLSPPAKKP